MFGVFLLSSGVQGWFFGARAVWYLRCALIIAALCMIAGGWLSDAVGLAIAAATVLVQRVLRPTGNPAVAVRGAD